MIPEDLPRGIDDHDPIDAAFAELRERNARRTIAAALRDRMRLLYEAAINARHLGCEDAARALFAAHNEASDVLAAVSR
jgi:hypothetical protein